MGKFFFTVGKHIETSYMSLFNSRKLHDVSADQVRAAIKPNAIATLRLFDDYDSALTYASSTQEYESKSSSYPTMRSAVYKVYVLEVPKDIEIIESVASTKTAKKLPRTEPDAKKIAYIDITNDENNVIVYSGHHYYKTNPDVFIDRNYYEQIFSKYFTITESVIALFNDYVAPVGGILPKTFFNYHFVPVAQQLANEIANAPNPEAIYQLLKAKHQQLIADPTVNRTGSFVTAIEFAMQKLNAHLYGNQTMNENDNVNNNNASSSSYQYLTMK